ncbi:MAG: phosphoglucosamine mutase [Bacteroidales bacterium]|nr:phosphoglucosamine mutase [Bacteroidales bacterium]
MTLIKSISGIRGTIGGSCGDALTPLDIVKFTAAYVKCLPKQGKKAKVVVGRDARISGSMVENLVCGTLVGCGADVVNIGMATTPTTELAVTGEKADGGIIITASHNPEQWNALKLLNSDGEFLSAANGAQVLETAAKEDFDFAEVRSLGSVTYKDYTDIHIEQVLSNHLVDLEAIRNARFKVVLDPINSVGAIVMPRLLERLGVECITINAEPNGCFAHNPEPLPANLRGLSETVCCEHASLGISVDPDVDRLAFICEDGEPFGEEYTLVSVADYVLRHKKGPTCSNISSSRALRDVTEAHGCEYFAAAVGEVNVTTKMREVGAVIGGEGNGGVIFPELHYGRDALIGTALFLSNLAQKGLSASNLRKTYPDYFIAKKKISLNDASQADKIFEALKDKYASEKINTMDGVRIDFEKDRKWVILRKSNTEPIIRIYAEAPGRSQAEALADEVIAVADSIL